MYHASFSSPEEFQRFVEVCRLFEDACKAGQSPGIEGELAKWPQPVRCYVFDELLHLELHYFQDTRTRDMAEYQQRFPEYASQIATAFQEFKQPPNQQNPNKVLTPDEPEPETVQAKPECINRYKIERVLGKGGFGIVYLAHDWQLQRLVAIKVPHARLVAQAGDANAYLTEARTVANLDHPNIVPVHDVGSTDEFPCFVVSKYIDGTDLATILRQSRLSINETVELVATVAEALHYAHKQGLVHRDIKPGNILLDKSGKPFVGDFGLALREQDVGKGPRYAGTPAYMSPEQARGEGHRVDGRSDIFSLGVVFYELLTGRRPFHAVSREELLDQIATHETRPPRQWDETIPKELERICLKALAKRASERYTAAKDMADDLTHFLAEFVVNEQSAPPSKGTQSAPPVMQPSAPVGVVNPSADSSTPALSDSRQIKIVPKGLRSFDAHDADFFLEILPGPRDREGLPDSIRFWKTRIEEKDPDDTFSVGLIYGPSGCGKSSLMKAGLLPHLSTDVIAVYLEATAEETEKRLLNGLRKRCPALPPNMGLKETLAALRRGRAIPAGKKVLIVLDQFEQWLHAKRESQNTELVQALRQCDGEQVQCIVMVRDDFWMAATRFMRELEIRLLEGQNSAAVDLFPIRHAAKVLAAFGRAFGALPENAKETSKEQKQFIEQAVSGLAQEAKVICVRLALFAEMMKGKAWTPASLKAVGGTEGVGVTFLEETFSAATASPERRYHQKAARADLKALLPETGSDIKGSMRSYAELLEASGYASRPKDFDDLIRILDNEIRLITPTDPEGKDAGEPGGVSPRCSAARYYQLTHDYLVHSLREWLTRKQKETRRGRAELLLADRAAVWSARPENRQLPSLVQWFSIGWWTRKKTWTPSQKKMMRKANRHHLTRAAVLAGLLLVGTLVGLSIRSQVVEQNKATYASGLVNQLLAAKIEGVPGVIKEIEAYRFWADPLLKEENAKAKVDSPQKLYSSLALLPADNTQVDYLCKRLLDVQPQDVSVIRDALLPHKRELVDRLWSVVDQPLNGKESQRLRAASALATYDPDNSRWDKSSGPVVEQLVSENPVYLALWMEGFRPVRIRLLPSLAGIFKDRKDERTSERTLATNILVDYAADQPQVLADLLMDADEKQFARVFPILKDHRDRGLALLQSEVVKPLPSKGLEVFKKAGTIAQDDAKVKISTGTPLPAKVFEVPLQAGKTYHIAMDSKDLDSFLVLQDKSGKEIAFDDDGGGNQNAFLIYKAAKEDTYKVYAASFKGTGSFLLTIVEAVDENAKEKVAKRQANAAVALLMMDRPEKVWPLLKHSPDPRVRSYLIHRFGPLGADARAIIKRLDEEPNVTIRRALVLSLGEFSDKDFSPDQRKAMLPKLREIYKTATDAGLHAAAEWLLRTWNEEDWLKKMNEKWRQDKEQRKEHLARIATELASRAASAPGVPTGAKAQWYVNSRGQTMVVIPGPVEDFEMGSPPTEAGRQEYETQHKKRIGRTFAIAAKAVTVEEYREFTNDIGIKYELPALYTRMPNLPVVRTSWYQAAAYCNWLSKKEGLPKSEWCYEPLQNTRAIAALAGSSVGLLGGSLDSLAAACGVFPGRTDPEYKEGMKLARNYLKRQGYRLPTEAEMEYATRAEAVTSRYYGESEELLPKYAWHVKNSKEQTWPVGSLKPNDLGLFDVQGNVFTWCQESYKAYPRGKGDKAVEDTEDVLVIGASRRELRGPSFNTRASNVRSAYRNNNVPSLRNSDVGFRAARTLLLDGFTTLQLTLPP